MHASTPSTIIKSTPWTRQSVVGSSTNGGVPHGPSRIGNPPHGPLVSVVLAVGWPAGTNLQNLQIHASGASLRGSSIGWGFPYWVLSLWRLHECGESFWPARGVEGWRRRPKATGQSVPYLDRSTFYQLLLINLRLVHPYLFQFEGKDMLHHNDGLRVTLFSCIPGSAGTRQTHMTLNSDSKVSWDCFGLSDGKVQETSPALFTCLVVTLITHLYISTSRWRKVGKRKCIWWPGARQVGLSLPYLKQAEYNRCKSRIGGQMEYSVEIGLNASCNW